MRVFEFDTLPESRGRAQTTYPGAWALTSVIPGDMFAYNAEGAAGASAAVFTLAQPVRFVVVTATVPVFVAKTAAAAAATGTGKEGDRYYVPANTPTALPWYQDEVWVQAVSTTGTVYLSGRV